MIHNGVAMIISMVFKEKRCLKCINGPNFSMNRGGSFRTYEPHSKEVVQFDIKNTPQNCDSPQVRASTGCHFQYSVVSE